MVDLNDKTLFWRWGEGLRRSPTGGLLMVDKVEQIEQRIVRRLLTVAEMRLSDGELLRGEYYQHPKYGFSLRQRVGQLLSSNQVSVLQHQIREAVKQDQSVDATVDPVVNVYKANHDVFIEILFTIVDGDKARIIIPG